MCSTESVRHVGQKHRFCSRPRPIFSLCLRLGFVRPRLRTLPYLVKCCGVSNLSIRSIYLFWFHFVLIKLWCPWVVVIETFLPYSCSSRSSRRGKECHRLTWKSHGASPFTWGVRPWYVTLFSRLFFLLTFVYSRGKWRTFHGWTPIHGWSKAAGSNCCISWLD